MVGLLDYVQRLIGIPENMSGDPAAQQFTGVPRPQRNPRGLLDLDVPRPKTKPLDLDVPRPKTKPSFTFNREKLKSSIVDVETGGEKNPFVFTRVQPRDKKSISSGFGPAQITYTLAQDVLNRASNLPDDRGFRDYLSAFIRQGKDRVNAYRKNLKNVPKSLSGGSAGTIPMELHRAYYPTLLDLALDLKMSDAQSFDPETIAKAWYGGTPKKSEQYAKKVMSRYTR